MAVREGRVVGFLTVEHHFEPASEISWMAVQLLLVLTVSSLEAEPRVADGYQWTRAFYQSVGFLPARELPDLWPGNRALLLVMSLDDSNPTILS